MAKRSRLEELKSELEMVASRAKLTEELMSRMVKLLHDRMLKFNWVGFYMLGGRKATGTTDVGAWII